MNDYKIIEFRYLNIEDRIDNTYNDGHAWSRIYEYPFVLDCLRKYANAESLVHNSSWGYQGVHVTFKEELDKVYKNSIHSDIQKSNYKNTFFMDITVPPSTEHLNKYDFVINISTLEEVDFDHFKILQNLLDQVKPLGYLILTFDIKTSGYVGVGSLNVDLFEKILKQKIISYGSNNLSSINSFLPNLAYYCNDLNCGVLVIQKL